MVDTITYILASNQSESRICLLSTFCCNLIGMYKTVRGADYVHSSHILLPLRSPTVYQVHAFVIDSLENVKILIQQAKHGWALDAFEEFRILHRSGLVQI